jgi:hypothetical protein
LKEHFCDFIGYDEVDIIVFDGFDDDVVFEIGLDGGFSEMGKDGGSEVGWRI